MAQPFVISVVGPTASGKSAVADSLALHECSCVISADSMQIYKGLDIGTAKTPLDQRQVPYYGIDITDPHHPYSVAQYQEYAREVIDSYLAQGKNPVLCGGTGLYVRAVLEDMRFPAGGQIDNAQREIWQHYLEMQGPEALYQQLVERDPQSASVLDGANTKRVIRALEMHASGDSYYQQALHFKERRPLYRVCSIGLSLPREVLYDRIVRRVDEMVEAGLVQEAQTLYEQGIGQSYTAQHAIGYKELFEVFKGEISQDEAIEMIKQHSRQYAKRQLTWFRRDETIQWIDGCDQGLDSLVNQALEIVEAYKRGESNEAQLR